MKCEDWHSKFITVLDRHAPFTCKQSRKRPSEPPWSDRELYQLTMRKNRLHKRWLSDKTCQQAHSAFKQARSGASNAYRRKRNEFFRNKCAENTGNPRQLWSVINSVTGRKRTHQGHRVVWRRLRLLSRLSSPTSLGHPNYSCLRDPLQSIS